MNPAIAVISGFVMGAALGVVAGRDLVHSIHALSGPRGRRSAAWGFVRRTGIFAAALFGSLLLGPWAWAGTAAGYLGGFGVTVWREVRANVG